MKLHEIHIALFEGKFHLHTAILIICVSSVAVSRYQDRSAGAVMGMSGPQKIKHLPSGPLHKKGLVNPASVLKLASIVKNTKCSAHLCLFLHCGGCQELDPEPRHVWQGLTLCVEYYLFHNGYSFFCSPVKRS